MQKLDDRNETLQPKSLMPFVGNLRQPMPKGLIFNLIDYIEVTARLPVPLIFSEESGPDSSLCWIAILDMKIVILIDDANLVETTIESAGRIYKLSSMQTLVATEIAKGEELTSIANTLDVSTNTVRTHVKRIFQRIGVNSQKALLMRLLVAQSPATRIQKTTLL